jgi:hypothetical protein
MIQEMPKAVSALAAYEGRDNQDEAFAAKVARAEEDALLAGEEVRSDFQLLRGLSLVSVWSTLENLVKSLVVAWAIHDKKWLRSDALKNVKLPMSDFLSMSPNERAWYLADHLDQVKSASLRQGVNRFESLLEVIGLSGSVTKEVADTLFELHQLRNLLVHRGGVIDRRFKTAFPKMKCKLGEPVQLSQRQVSQIHAVAIRYLTEIICRIGDTEGMNLREPASLAGERKAHSGRFTQLAGEGPKEISA